MIAIYFVRKRGITACLVVLSHICSSHKGKKASMCTGVSCFCWAEMFLIKWSFAYTPRAFSYNPKSHLFLQEQSQLPATVLLAQHKVRAAQLESQIEQQKQVVKPTSLFSTGIQLVSTTHKFIQCKEKQQVLMPIVSFKIHVYFIKQINYIFCFRRILGNWENYYECHTLPSGVLPCTICLFQVIYQKELWGPWLWKLSDPRSCFERI